MGYMSILNAQQYQSFSDKPKYIFIMDRMLL